MGKIVLNAIDIYKSYTNGANRLNVLDKFSLPVMEGEIITIMGQSGSGKSTALNILGTLDKPDSGVLEINGVNIDNLNENDISSLRNKDLGFIFQFHHLLPELTALENVMIPQMLNGLSQTESEKRAKLLLEMVGLSDRATHRPGLLSGGEQQRVAIARSVANAPDILLADEPTGNLDPETGETVFQSLQRIVHGTDTAALIVTHNQKLAAKMDEILELENGNIKRKQLP